MSDSFPFPCLDRHTERSSSTCRDLRLSAPTIRSGHVMRHGSGMACFDDRGKEPVTVLPEVYVPTFGISAQGGTRKGYQRFRYTFFGLPPTSSDPDEEPTWLQTLLCGLSVEFVKCRTTVFFPKSQSNTSESFVTPNENQST